MNGEDSENILLGSKDHTLFFKKCDAEEPGSRLITYQEGKTVTLCELWLSKMFNDYDTNSLFGTFYSVGPNMFAAELKPK